LEDEPNSWLLSLLATPCGVSRQRIVGPPNAPAAGRVMDHSQAPVLHAIELFRERGDIVYGPPGHKQGRGTDPRDLKILGEGVYASDILLLNGLDDRRESQGVLSQAQELMADAVGADQAFFSTCGSSLSVRSAMMAVAGPGEKLLVSRNAHKSVISALILGGIEPVWVHPHFDSERYMSHPPEPADVEEALRRAPDAKGMLLITPTDWGTCADIKGVAEVCHAHGIVLIVDEAWGAHLPFHDELPQWGMNTGADLVVTSAHKMGGAVEQSSVFHLQGDRVDPAVLAQREDILATTSASSLVYATLDGWRRQMVEHGAELLTATLRRAERIRAEVARIEGYELLDERVIGTGGAFELDPLKIVIDVSALGITGFQSTEWLRAECHLDLGAADTRRMLAQLTHGDDDHTEQRLIEGLRRLREHADQLEKQPPVRLPEPGDLELEIAMLPRDAFFARAEQVPIDQAAGRIAAELLSPYPPGVPVAAPGEVLTQGALDYLSSGLSAGMLIPDAADASLQTLRVVAR
jgi:arginine decarboxylase